jgi:hypothetical protein
MRVLKSSSRTLLGATTLRVGGGKHLSRLSGRNYPKGDSRVLPRYCLTAVPSEYKWETAQGTSTRHRIAVFERRWRLNCDCDMKISSAISIFSTSQNGASWEHELLRELAMTMSPMSPGVESSSNLSFLVEPSCLSPSSSSIGNGNGVSSFSPSIFSPFGKSASASSSRLLKKREYRAPSGGVNNSDNILQLEMVSAAHHGGPFQDIL